ncbi:MAG: hypothetical protein CFE21_02050 [Bacteroidetes bacterium B1(2017)]|nr:MAG: hypothetical protein CFE21_02050 [Bacteroidetes bacterium B1(2017)]
MDKLKSRVLFICALFIGLIANAQRVEVGLLLGASNYLGDLSNETVLMKETHFAASVFGRYNFSPKFAMSGFFGYARVSGDDKNFAGEKRNYVLNKVAVQDFEFNKYRNLNFYSDVYEFSAHAEYNLLPNNLTSYTSRPFLPYVFMGIGIFNFNPKSTYGNKVVELQPLATEGQGSTTYNEIKKYPLTAVCLPVGFGFRQKIGDDFFLGFEAGVRFTSTNYLDDVGGVYGSGSVIYGATGKSGLLMSDKSWELNPNADPNSTNPLATESFMFHEGDKRSDRTLNKHDMYFMAGVTLSYTIRFRGQGCPQF